MRVTVGLLLVTTSMKPGSWCVKPLWSWRQTVEDSRIFSEATGARQGTWFCDVEPLGVLVEHRVHDVGEGLVGVEEAVAPGEQVALEPAVKVCSESISMTRPSGDSSPPSASSGSRSAIQALLVTS